MHSEKRKTQSSFKNKRNTKHSPELTDLRTHTHTSASLNKQPLQCTNIFEPLDNKWRLPGMCYLQNIHNSFLAA